MEDKLRTAISEVLVELGLTEVAFSIEHPRELAHGDYATNAALVAFQEISKIYGEAEDSEQDGLIFNSPKDLAETLVKRLEGKLEGVEEISVAGPGFVNFTLEGSFFKDSLSAILKDSVGWGKNTEWKGKKVIVEYTDPNPFKEFHIGHLFTNSVGESISRLFEMAGADVVRANYQGDVGLHVACAIWGMQQLGLTGVRDFSAQELGKAYALGATTYKNDEKIKPDIETINKVIYERSDEVVSKLYDKGRAVSLEYFEGIYKKIGTSFDEYFFESDAGPRGKELVRSHTEIFPESNGAYVFEGEKHGLHTRVFLNSQGLPTYESKELALAKMKEEQVGIYDLSIVSTSNEITEYFKVLKKAMSFVYPELAEKTEHVGHGTVRLMTGKMSSRTGDVIPALDFIGEIAAAVKTKMEESGELADEELAEQIAIGAIKYATLKSGIYQDSVFDPERALSFEGDSGPYLQYTHARISSVLEKAKDAGISPSTTDEPDEPYEVERILYRFPETVHESLSTRDPHHVAQYLTELAGTFNSFYAVEKIADSEDELAPYKCALAEAVQVTLKNGLWVLGIKAPERM